MFFYRFLDKKDEKNYFSDPSNIERAFRFVEPPRESRNGTPYANPGAAPVVTNAGQPDEEVHFGGKRTKSRRR
jgi:hypothetical protein